MFRIVKFYVNYQILNIIDKTAIIAIGSKYIKQLDFVEMLYGISIIFLGLLFL